MSHQITGNHSQHSGEVRKAATTFDNLPSTGLIRQPQVLEIVPFSSATLWRRCRSGQFPKPVKLSERITAWRVGEVRAWLSAQGAAQGALS